MIRDDSYNRLLQIKEELVENCEVCGGTGYLDVEDGEDNYCECMIRFEWIVQLVSAEIPYAYWHLSLSDLVVDKKYKKFIQYFNRNMKSAVKKSLGLLLRGANGVGKTSLMAEVGKSALVKGYKVRYTTVQKYMASVIDDKDYIEWVMDSEVLLLDELDKVYIKSGSSFVKKTLEEMLRRALVGGRAMVICTNWDENELVNTFGNSTMSLLRRQLKFLYVTGEDYSQTLQDSWESKLEESEHYHSESLDKRAWQYHERIMEESGV